MTLSHVDMVIQGFEELNTEFFRLVLPPPSRASLDDRGDGETVDTGEHTGGF